MARETINGHYKGSNKAKIREVFDKHGAKRAMKKAEDLGIAISTARNYISEFTTGNAPKPRKAAAVKKSTTKKSPAKKVVKKAAKKVTKKAPAAKKVKVAELHG